jgi:hypothetical protein
MLRFDEANGKRPGLHEVERLPYGISVLLIGGMSVLSWATLVLFAMALSSSI